MQDSSISGLERVLAVNVWLFGDSIFRGASVVHRPDLIDAEEARRVPLWPFRNPAAVMNLVLGGEVVRHGGRTRLPNGMKECSRELWALFDSGQFGPQDVIVMLDVGRHGGDPDAHEAAWRRLLQAALVGNPARVVICEGFDGGARGQLTHQYSHPFGARTMNDAIRAAALSGPEGVVVFLPLAETLQRFDRWLAATCGVGAYRPDGIHLNVWGQFRLCGAVLPAALPARPVDLERLLEVAASLEAHLEIKGEQLREVLLAAFAPADGA